MTYPPADYSSDILPLDCQAPRSRWQEWFSWAFVGSVAAAAGLVPQVLPIDANQTDIMIQSWHPIGGEVRSIGLQLKSTYYPDFVHHEQYVVHDLEGERYNRLLEASRVPRFFVIVAVPPPPAALVTCNAADALLGAAAWWGEVEGEPTDQAWKRVRLPTSQRFDAAGVLEMLKT